MIINNSKKIESNFNKIFIKSYLIYSTIVSFLILTSFLLLKLDNFELKQIQDFLSPYLIKFLIITSIFTISSLIYFRIFTPKWIFKYADKKLYIDLFIFALLILSYIPSTILVYSYIFTYFNKFVIYSSYLFIFTQIPNFIAGIIASIANNDYLIAITIFLLSISRFIFPILLFFSYPSPSKKIINDKENNNESSINTENSINFNLN